MKKQYKVKYENGNIKPLENLLDVKDMTEGIVLFFDLNDDNLDVKKSNSNKLSKYAGSWSGNDIEECLKSLKENRLDAEF